MYGHLKLNSFTFVFFRIVFILTFIGSFFNYLFKNKLYSPQKRNTTQRTIIIQSTDYYEKQRDKKYHSNYFNF